MKIKVFYKKLSFILFVFSLLIVYLWIYVSPSVKKISKLKRDIKEYSLKISSAHTEKTTFVYSDRKESLLFREAELEFSRKLDAPDNPESSFESEMRRIGEKAGIKRLKISGEPEEGESDYSFYGSVKIGTKNRKMSFSAGFRYGAEFIRLLPGSEQYLLIKGIKAEREGVYYLFNIITEYIYVGNNDIGESGAVPEGENDLIDMNSPLLKRPVYLSPMKLKNQQISDSAKQRR